VINGVQPRPVPSIVLPPPVKYRPTCAVTDQPGLLTVAAVG